MKINIKFKVTDAKTGGVRIMVYPKVSWFIKRKRYTTEIINSDGVVGVGYTFSSKERTLTPYYVI